METEFQTHYAPLALFADELDQLLDGKRQQADKAT